MSLIFRIALLLCLTCGSFTASAQMVYQQNAFDRGWYANLFGIGSPVGHVVMDPNNDNYIVGFTFPNPNPFSRLAQYRNYFAFDLSAYAGQTFSDVTLRIYNPVGFPPIGGFFQNSPNALPYETFVLHDVTTNATDLLSGAAGEAGYADLGEGVVFGSYNASLADNGRYIQIVLNGSGVDALNGAVNSGGIFIVGGMISTFDTPGFGSQVLFNASGGSSNVAVQMFLTTAPVPEPETYAMMVAGLGLIGFAARRRKQQFI
jgi:hypothetical protein